MKKFAFLAAAALAGASAPAMSAVYVVDAQINSSTGGTALSTGLNFTAGDLFKVSVATTDLWSAGSLPRWSNANGLTSDLFATGADESGQPNGTKIGQSFSLWTQNGFSAPYGALVGQIGTSYKLLGTSFSGPAWATGELKLFYWDSNKADNVGSISATIAAVPEPATWAMMIGGLGLVGLQMRRSRTAVSFA